MFLHPPDNRVDDVVAFRRGHFVKNAKLILHMKKETETRIKLSDLKLNDGSYGLPKNPRFIRDERFKKLCDSLRDFPEAMPVRGIVVDECGVILGGNMRYRACLANGMKEIPASWVHRLTGLTVEQKRRFIIMDNSAFGEYDTDILSSMFDDEELVTAGYDVPSLIADGELEPIEEQIEDLKPIKRLHILISMTADQAIDLLPQIESLVEKKGAQIHHAGN